MPPTNLVELNQAIQDIKHNTQQFVLEYLKDLCEKNDIRICSEFCTFEEIGVIAKNAGRIMLSNSKKQGAYTKHSQLYYECNGIIIDTTDWKLISTSMPSFNKRIEAKIINDGITNDTYNFYRIIDGTIITLYHYNDKWIISTSNGYDVSNYYWMGNKTYAEVFDDLLTRKYPLFKQNMTNLDKNKCYTLGFRHHNFHFLKNDPELIWLIKITELTTLSNIQEDLYDIKIQQPEELSVYTLDGLKNLPQFIDSLPNAIKGISYCYGYILRSGDRNLSTDYLIQSQLLSTIKQLMYENKIEKSIREKITHENREIYNTWKSFLYINTRDNFQSLRPDIRSLFLKMDEFVNNVIFNIIQLIKGNPIVQQNSEIFKSSHTLYKFLMETENIKTYTKDTESIVRDLLINPENAYFFMRSTYQSINYDKSVL